MTRPDALRKVVALQRKACDPAVTPYEAASCARKAAELRLAHGLTADEIRLAASGGVAGQPNGSPPRGSRPTSDGGRPATGRPRPPDGGLRPPLGGLDDQEWQRLQREAVDMVLSEFQRAVRRALRT